MLAPMRLACVVSGGAALVLLASGGCAALAGLDRDYVERAPADGSAGSDDGPHPSPDADAGSGCEAGGRLCGASCVDPLTSSAHCGACDKPCATRCEGGACVPWDPSFLPGVALWIRADRGVTADGGHVSTWKDLVGAHDLAQVESAKRPTLVLGHASFNNEPATDFDGTDDVLSTSDRLDLSKGFTVAQVLRFDGWTSKYTGPFRLGTTPTSGGTLVFYSLGGILVWSMDGGGDTAYWKASPGALTLGGTYSLLVQYDGTDRSRRVFVNGADRTAWGSFTGTWTLPAPDAFHVGVGYGGEHGATAGPMDGQIAETVVVTRVLSDDERARLDTYLRARYAHY